MVRNRGPTWVGVRNGRQRRWVDNVFVERLWRSVKYENVYLNAYATIGEAKTGLQAYFAFYNRRRPHSSPNGRTPDSVYFNSMLPLAA